MKLKITREEFYNLLKFRDREVVYLELSLEKILIFHGDPKKRLEISIVDLYQYHNSGYKFLSCFPKKMKERIGFGNFLFPEYDDEILATGQYSEYDNPSEVFIEITIK